jgi:hypothetical protein
MNTTFSSDRLPLQLLNDRLASAGETVHEVAEVNPDSLDSLIATYEGLGQAIATAEACLVAALDSLDTQTGGGRTSDEAGYTGVKDNAFSLLRRAGAQFARFDSAFGRLVHGSGGWPNKPVYPEARTLYTNTFKTSDTLEADSRQQEYDKRVQKFLAGGGDFGDIIPLDKHHLERMVNRVHYDYVMLPDYSTRVYPTAREHRGGKPKAGHSLLVGTEERFEDNPILMAGELWVLKDTAGDLEAVIIANNSGHYKPFFKDLDNVVPGLMQLGMPAERIVLFGGPNNIPTIFREISEIHGITDLEERLAPSPDTLLERWGA